MIIEWEKQIYIIVNFLAVYFNCLPKASKENFGKIDEKDMPPIEKGVTMELCAGIVDRDEDISKIAQSEVLEECGYKVPLENFEKVMSHKSGIGVSGERQTLYYASVDDSMKVSSGKCLY